MNRVRSEWELYRILQQLGLLDMDGRAMPDAFAKIRQLARVSADSERPGWLPVPWH